MTRSATLLLVSPVLIGLVVLAAGGELLIRGASALVSAARITPLVIQLDLPIMIATTLAGLPIFFTGRRISRGDRS